jgi:hypothetical protein
MLLRSSAILLPVFLVSGCSGAPKAGFADDFTDAGPDAAPIYDPPPAWSGGAPALVASSQAAVSLALDDTRVYWQGAGGSVFDCPLGGCPNGKARELSSLIGSSSESLQTLGASDGVTVFLTNNGNSITSLAVAHPDKASTTYTATGCSTLGLLVNDADHVYFVDCAAEKDGGSVEMLAACPLGGPCASPKTLYSSEFAYSFGPLFVAGSEIFFADQDDDGYSIRAVSTQGGPARKVCSLGSDYSNVEDIAVAGGFVYVTNSDDSSSIYDCAASGGTTPVVYVRDLAPYALATDGTNLYWTNYQGKGSVVTCALGKECTSPFTVASNQDAPFAIAANATSVFWSTSSSIFRSDK